MISASDIERADHLSRRRARFLPVLVVIYLSQQFSYFSGSALGERLVDHVKLGAWVILSTVMLALLATKGFWFHGTVLRELIDDEVTQANRSDALGWGFVASVATAISLYLLQQFDPLSAREAIHALVSIGLGVALLRFAFLERQGQR